jgi:hypothetical protein
MKRFIIAQLFELVDMDDPLYRDVGEKNVHDVDTQLEAEAWIAAQKNPDSFVIRDQLEGDTIEEEEFGDFSSLSSSPMFGYMGRQCEDDDFCEDFDLDLEDDDFGYSD